MMGGGPRKDKKFVNKIINQIQKGVTELNIIDDKLGTPTYTWDFAKNLHELMKTDYYGVYNKAGNGDCTRYAFAEELLGILKKSDCIKINKVHSEFFKEEYFAARPLSEKIINKKLELRGINLMGDWRGRLREYIEGYYRSFIGK